MVLPSYRPLGLAKCSRCGGKHPVSRSPTGAIVADPCPTKGAREAGKVKPADAGLAAELALAERLNEAGLVGWEREFYWALSERTSTGKPRQYRADFAYPKAMLLVEVEGQVHAIKAQRADDCARASLAAALGYRMVRVTKDMIVNGDAVRLVGRALEHGRAV